MSTPQLIEDCLKIKPGHKDFLDLYTYSEKVVTVLDLLSRTPDGQAVMPFLDVETKKVKEYWIQGEINGVPKECFEYFNLDHYLYREFTEALRVGKGFDLALQHINQLYIDSIYA